MESTFTFENKFGYSTHTIIGVSNDNVAAFLATSKGLTSHQLKLIRKALNKVLKDDIRRLEEREK